MVSQLIFITYSCVFAMKYLSTCSVFILTSIVFLYSLMNFTVVILCFYLMYFTVICNEESKYPLCVTMFFAV